MNAATAERKMAQPASLCALSLLLVLLELPGAMRGAATEPPTVTTPPYTYSYNNCRLADVSCGCSDASSNGSASQSNDQAKKADVPVPGVGAVNDAAVNRSSTTVAGGGGVACCVLQVAVLLAGGVCHFNFNANATVSATT
jgi:hypothetical protein